MINLDFKLGWFRRTPFRLINSVCRVSGTRALELNHYRDQYLLLVEFSLRVKGDHAPELRLGLGLFTHEFEIVWYDTRHYRIRG